jgi:gliding motility-associated transport system permease protein
VVGLFVSSLTKNQILAFIGSLGILLVLFFLQAVGQREFGSLHNFLEKLSLSSHYDDFAKGAIDLKHVAYYLMFIAFFLFATVRSVESRKWR